MPSARETGIEMRTSSAGARKAMIGDEEIPEEDYDKIGTLEEVTDCVPIRLG